MGDSLRSSHTLVRHRQMLIYLAACQVYNEVLQTWRMFSAVGLQTTITEKRGNLIQRLLSLIYDVFTVKLDKKEEKWRQDDENCIGKTLRVISLLIFLPLSPSFNHPSLLSLFLQKFRKSKHPYFHRGWTRFLSQLLKHETQMVCKCRLWFCLMYPGYKVQRIKEPFPLCL